MSSEVMIFVPKNLGELLSYYGENPQAHLVAGGLEYMRNQEDRPPQLIDLLKVEDLQRIRRTERYLYIGSCVPISRILSVRRHVVPRVLFDALASIPGPAIRNMATLGGNLCQSPRHSDVSTALTVLEARVELRSNTGDRRVSLPQFLAVAGKGYLGAGEVLTNIRIPAGSWNVQVFRKINAPGSREPALLTFCGLARVFKGTISELRFAIGSRSPGVLREKKLESPFIGRKLPLQGREIEQLLAPLTPLLREVDGLKSGDHYQVRTALRLTRWFLRELNRFDVYR
jgi:xanthine dehydrogenase FAD-binding subunit